jgi:peroxiredoxin
MTPSSQQKSVNITGFLVLGLIVVLLAGLVLAQVVSNDGAPVSNALDNTGADTISEDGRTSDSHAGPLRQGSVAPDFTLPDLEGQRVSLSEWRGRPVLINFWATWCGPCELEMPTIQAAYEAHQDDGLVVLAVAVDDTEGNVKRFFQKRDLTIRPLMDDGSASRAYQVFGLPTSFLVQEDGKIAAVHAGLLTERKLEEYLRQFEGSQ